MGGGKIPTSVRAACELEAATQADADHYRVRRAQAESVLLVRPPLPGGVDHEPGCQRLGTQRVHRKPSGQRVVCAMPLGRSPVQISVLPIGHRASCGKRRSAHDAARYRGWRAAFQAVERSEDRRRVRPPRRRSFSEDRRALSTRARHPPLPPNAGIGSSYSSLLARSFSWSSGRAARASSAPVSSITTASQGPRSAALRYT